MILTFDSKLGTDCSTRMESFGFTVLTASGDSNFARQKAIGTLMGRALLANDNCTDVDPITDRPFFIHTALNC